MKIPSDDDQICRVSQRFDQQNNKLGPTLHHVNSSTTTTTKCGKSLCKDSTKCCEHGSAKPTSRFKPTQEEMQAGTSHEEPKAGDQLTLDNRVAFQAECDCKVCKAKEIKKWMPSCSIPKRAHHPLCNLNAKTRGLGEVTASTLEENKRFKALMSTIHPSEKCSAKHMTKESAATFFQPRVSHPMTATIAAATASPATNVQCLPVSFGKTVGDLVKCADFRERHKNKGAPLAMIAFANEVTNHMKEQKGALH